MPLSYWKLTPTALAASHPPQALTQETSQMGQRDSGKTFMFKSTFTLSYHFEAPVKDKKTKGSNTSHLNPCTTMSQDPGGSKRNQTPAKVKPNQNPLMKARIEKTLGNVTKMSKARHHRSVSFPSPSRTSTPSITSTPSLEPPSNPPSQEPPGTTRCPSRLCRACRTRCRARQTLWRPARGT